MIGAKKRKPSDETSRRVAGNRSSLFQQTGAVESIKSANWARVLFKLRLFALLPDSGAVERSSNGTDLRWGD